MDIWQIIGHVIVFIAIGGSSYGISIFGKDSNWPFALLILTPIVGVYFLGWWALLTCFLGFVSGNYASVNEKFKGR